MQVWPGIVNIPETFEYAKAEDAKAPRETSRQIGGGRWAALSVQQFYTGGHPCFNRRLSYSGLAAKHHHMASGDGHVVCYSFWLCEQ